MVHVRIHSFSNECSELNDDGTLLRGNYWALHTEDGKRITKYNGPYKNPKDAEPDAIKGLEKFKSS